MSLSELEKLELTAQIDSLVRRLRLAIEDAPDWETGDAIGALVERLVEKTDLLRVRLERPLVVAMLGGTGTGKSSLVNALLGGDYVQTGRQRPTTMRPKMLAQSNVTPEMLGLAPEEVEYAPLESPLLTDLVLIDCPDPDTTEEQGDPGENLARLRAILPYCDLVLVTSTQQKYRSAKVSDELFAAASGARIIFVQTHADKDEDIRDDWQEQLRENFEEAKIFRVNSLESLAIQKEGLAPSGDFAQLRDLLANRLRGTAAAKIRRANFFDLTWEALGHCLNLYEKNSPELKKLRDAIDRSRSDLSEKLANEMEEQLPNCRRQWEYRLVGEVASRWNFSPMALVLRGYHSLGSLATGAMLLRARSPAQMAVVGTIAGIGKLRKRRKAKNSEAQTAEIANDAWDQTRLREAVLVVEGYVAAAGLSRKLVALPVVEEEAQVASDDFVNRVATRVDEILAKVAKKSAGFFTRAFFETLLLAFIAVILYRLGKNYFWDSWLAVEFSSGKDSAAEPLTLSFYVSSLLWLLAWCFALVGLLTCKLRFGLKRRMNELATAWREASTAEALFGGVSDELGKVERLRGDLDLLRVHIAHLRDELAIPPDVAGKVRKK